MKNKLKKIGFHAIVSCSLTEIIHHLYKKDPGCAGFIKTILSGRQWRSSRVTLCWMLRKTKADRFYLQLAIRAQKADNSHRVLFPTPVASDGNRKLLIVDGKISNRSAIGVRYGVTIRQLAEEGLLPTPRSILARAKCDVDRGKGNLEDTIAKFAAPRGATKKINPCFIVEMMGFPGYWLMSPFEN